MKAGEHRDGRLDRMTSEREHDVTALDPAAGEAGRERDRGALEIVEAECTSPAWKAIFSGSRGGARREVLPEIARAPVALARSSARPRVGTSTSTCLSLFDCPSSRDRGRQQRLDRGDVRDRRLDALGHRNEVEAPAASLDVRRERRGDVLRAAARGVAGEALEGQRSSSPPSHAARAGAAEPGPELQGVRRPARRPIRSTASAKRRGETQTPIQPSPRRRARSSAASERPPTRIGIGGSGAGRMAASRTLKWRPDEVDRARRSGRRARASSASVVRRPRVRGSTPHSSSSRGSSPPTPTPNVKRPGGERRRSSRAGARDRCRVADAQQVDAGLDRERGVGGEQRHRLDEAVGTVAAGEADVVADGQVVDPRRGRSARELAEPAAIGEQVGFPEDEADADAFHGHIHEVRSI